MNRIEISKAAHLTGHRNPVYAIENGVGANTFYTAGNDKGIVAWDLQWMRVRQVLCPVEHTVYALYRLPGTEWMLAAMRDGTVLLLDIGEDEAAGESGVATESGAGPDENIKRDRILARIRHYTKPVFAVGSFLEPVSGHGQHADGGAGDTGIRIVIASEDGTASVWSVTRGPAIGLVLLRQVTISAEPLRCLDVSPDGQTIAFGTKDGLVSLYSTTDLSLQKVLEPRSMPVTALRFSPDGRYLLSAGRDAELHIYHTDDYRHANIFVPHLFAIYSIRYHPVLPVFATGSRDKSIKIWSAEDFRLLRVISLEKGLEAHRLSVNALAWDTSGRYLLSTGDDKAVMVWDIKESTNETSSQ